MIYNFRLPFNWKTLIGYLLAEILIIIYAICSFLIIGNSVCFFCGFCWLYISFADDISSDIIALNDSEVSQRVDKELVERFINIVQLHVDVKQLSA